MSQQASGATNSLCIANPAMFNSGPSLGGSPVAAKATWPKTTINQDPGQDSSLYSQNLNSSGLTGGRVNGYGSGEDSGGPPGGGSMGNSGGLKNPDQWLSSGANVVTSSPALISSAHCHAISCGNGDMIAPKTMPADVLSEHNDKAAVTGKDVKLNETRSSDVSSWPEDDTLDLSSSSASEITLTSPECGGKQLLSKQAKKDGNALEYIMQVEIDEDLFPHAGGAVKGNSSSHGLGHTSNTPTQVISQSSEDFSKADVAGGGLVDRETPNSHYGGSVVAVGGGGLDDRSARIQEVVDYVVSIMCNPDAQTYLVPSVLDSQSEYRCDYCGDSLPNAANLRYHQRVYCGKNKLHQKRTCDFCGAVYNDLITFRQHYKQHYRPTEIQQRVTGTVNDVAAGAIFFPDSPSGAMGSGARYPMSESERQVNSVIDKVVHKVMWEEPVPPKAERLENLVRNVAQSMNPAPGAGGAPPGGDLSGAPTPVPNAASANAAHARAAHSHQSQHAAARNVGNVSTAPHSSHLPQQQLQQQAQQLHAAAGGHRYVQELNCSVQSAAAPLVHTQTGGTLQSRNYAAVASVGQPVSAGLYTGGHQVGGFVSNGNLLDHSVAVNSAVRSSVGTEFNPSGPAVIYSSSANDGLPQTPPALGGTGQHQPQNLSWNSFYSPPEVNYFSTLQPPPPAPHISPGNFGSQILNGFSYTGTPAGSLGYSGIPIANAIPMKTEQGTPGRSTIYPDTYIPLSSDFKPAFSVFSETLPPFNAANALMGNYNCGPESKFNS